MKFSINIFSLISLILLFGNCVSEFNPPSEGFEDLLVVDGLLTDEDEVFEVKLSRSFQIDTFEVAPESGARVKLISGSGESQDLYEVSSRGIYQSSSPINPQIGMSYKLIIQTQDGDNYESAEVEMRKTPEIDSIVVKREDQPTADLMGVQVYTNTHDPDNSTRYYRWEWEETWEFLMPYDAYLIWNDGEIQLRGERIFRCYKYGSSSSINIVSTKNLVQDRVNQYPLLYVSTETDRLSSRYSLLVKQYGLSEESYTYWKELRDITENLGTLFDPQPSIIIGNIRNTSDETEVVLGYFDVASVTEERIFIRRSDFPELRAVTYFSYCTDTIVSEGQIPDLIQENFDLVAETVNAAGFPAYLMSTTPCIDCRLYGSLEKPEYW